MHLAICPTNPLELQSRKKRKEDKNGAKKVAAQTKQQKLMPQPAAKNIKNLTMSSTDNLEGGVKTPSPPDERHSNPQPNARRG